jgi:predicted nucleic acid-binding protein
MKNKPRLYLDSCTFIDLVKEKVGLLPTGADRHDDVWFAKQLMKAHAADDVDLYTSYLAVAECVAIEAGAQTVPQNVQDEFRRLLTSGQHVTLWAPTPMTGRIAQDLRWKHGLVLRGADMLHVASALEAKCVEFITTDEELQKPKMTAAIGKLQSIGLSPIPARKTRYLPDDYKQGNFLDGKK